VNLSLINKHI